MKKIPLCIQRNPMQWRITDLAIKTIQNCGGVIELFCFVGKCLREITFIRKHAKIAQIAKSFTWYTATGPNQFGTNGKEPKPRVGQSILPQDYESPEAKWNQSWWLTESLTRIYNSKIPKKKISLNGDVEIPRNFGNRHIKQWKEGKKKVSAIFSWKVQYKEALKKEQ